MQTNKKTSSFLQVVVITVKLLLICSFIAVLVASVNFLTEDKILSNQKQKTASALSEIYTADGLVFSVNESGEYEVAGADGTPVGSCELAKADLLGDIEEIYVINNTDGSVFGYCVKTTPMGFKNEVGVLVAVNPDITVKDVQIISLSDTKGIGDKVTKRDFLDKFAGKKIGFTKDNSGLSDLIIAGATKTSKPVTLAIDEALANISEMVKGGTYNEQ